MTDSVTIGAEHEIPGGWRFEVRLDRPGAAPRSLTVRLTWQDYELWSQGTSPPASVVHRLIGAALELGAGERLRDDFDAGLIRRLVPTIDDHMRSFGGVG